MYKTYKKVLLMKIKIAIDLELNDFENISVNIT